MSKIGICMADGCEEIEGLTVVDIMRRAGLCIQTVSIKDTKEIEGSHGIRLSADLTFKETDFSDADMLVLPGGMPGTRYLKEFQPLRSLLTEYNERGGLIGAICAAPTVLSDLGFLKEKTALISHGSIQASRWLLSASTTVQETQLRRRGSSTLLTRTASTLHSSM